MGQPMRQTVGMMLCATLGLAAAAEISGAEVLVWHDEFEGETLDLSKWTAETGLVRNVRNASKMTHDFWEGREYPHFRLPFWFWWGGDRW